MGHSGHYPPIGPKQALRHNTPTYMALYARSGSTYEPAPEGTYSAVCVDVVDKGLQANRFEPSRPPQHKVVVVWEIDEQMEDGRRYTVNKQYTLSLHEKSAMRPDLVAWRGKQFTPEEEKEFDVETLIGAPCLLGVVHNASGGKTYANLSSISRLPKGMERLAPSADYERVKDRDGGWDRRSPNSTCIETGLGEPEPQAKLASQDDEMDIHADLPF